MTYPPSREPSIAVEDPDEHLVPVVDQGRIQRAVREILVAIGEDPEREGILSTPARVAAWWQEFLAPEPQDLDTTFEAVATDQMVAVTGIRVWSLCEHHLLPFWCDISIGYIAQDRVLGLSKFARLARRRAGRLQVQERLVDDIAGDVRRLARTTSVAVVGRGVHLCMLMRGVRTHATMTSSALTGAFRENPVARQEFMALVGMDGRELT